MRIINDGVNIEHIWEITLFFDCSSHELKKNKHL